MRPRVELLWLGEGEQVPQEWRLADPPCVFREPHAANDVNFMERRDFVAYLPPRGDRVPREPMHVAGPFSGGRYVVALRASEARTIRNAWHTAENARWLVECIVAGQVSA